jgi:hypothetical protein
MKGMPKSGHHPAKFLLSRPNNTCIATFVERHTHVGQGGRSRTFQTVVSALIGEKLKELSKS